MQKNQRFANGCFLLAIGLISLFAYTLLFSAIGFVRGYVMSTWQFPAGLVMMLITQYFAAHELFEIKPKQVFLKISGILIALILACLVFASSIYDVSFDGQWYHQETVIRIKTGWNPYFKELPVPYQIVRNFHNVWCTSPDLSSTNSSDTVQSIPYVKYLAVNYFSKGAEITSSAIYAFTNRIETGKAFNAILLLASFFLSLSALYKIDCWGTGNKWLFASFLTCNPVVIYQLTSYCLDGLMYSVLVSLVAVFVIIGMEKNKYAFFLFGLLILILVNLKFTAIPYAGTFCLGFVCYLLMKKQGPVLKKIVVAGSVSFLIGFFFIGFHPYMTNLIAHGNIFKGLGDTQIQNTQKEINSLTPSQLKDKNRFTKFLISNGSRSYDEDASDSSLAKVLKIPFSVNKQELMNANNAEIKIGGFGPFFSAALLVSVVLFGILISRYNKEGIFQAGLISIGFVLFSIFLIPDPWWARFVPQTWLLPCIVLFLAECLPIRVPVIRPVLYISLGLNIIWALSGILMNLMISAHINYQITQLKTLSQPISVEYCEFRDFRSNRIRFYENNIPFVEKSMTGKHVYNVIHSNTRFETPEELPAVSESFWMKMNRKLKAHTGMNE